MEMTRGWPSDNLRMHLQLLHDHCWEIRWPLAGEIGSPPARQVSSSSQINIQLLRPCDVMFSSQSSVWFPKVIQWGLDAKCATQVMNASMR